VVKFPINLVKLSQHSVHCLQLCCDLLLQINTVSRGFESLIAICQNYKSESRTARYDNVSKFGRLISVYRCLEVEKVTATAASLQST